MIFTYKYRLKDRSAKKRLRAHAIACNQVWNWCVATQRETQRRWAAGSANAKWLSQYDLQKLCKGVGTELGIHQQSVGGVCERFVAARAKKHSAPKFRASFGSKASLGFVPFPRQSRQIEGNGVTYLGKRFCWFGDKRRPLPETAKGGAFVEDSLGRWWVCFHVEVAETVCKAEKSVGIDLGLKSFATLSDGRKIEVPRYYRALEQQLGMAQRAGNKRQAKRIHLKIANARKDFLHKLSTSLVGEHSLIAVGDVSSSKLARTKMAKSVLDAGWSTFRSQLRYKSQQAGVAFLEVDESFTTQACSGCGSIAGPKGRAGLNKREWDCPDCGASHDRDVNSAKVILFRALSAQSRGDESRRAA
jgi:IS605 OrfB family transposase